MKYHRWVLQALIPCSVQVNEDGMAITKTGPVIEAINQNHLVMCFDCEFPMEMVFGNTCEGEKDETMPDRLWKDVP